MLKKTHIIRQSAKHLADAANRTVASLTQGRVQQEPAFTDRMLGRIEEAMDGYRVKGVIWNAMTLTDRSSGAQEKKYGADFLAVVEIAISGFVAKKGVLAQAKLIEPDESISLRDFNHMVEQCNKMLSYSPASFVFLYSQSGISIVSALSVAGLQPRINPHEAYSQSTQRFFEILFECVIGDKKLHTATIGTLDQLTASANRWKSRSALWLRGTGDEEDGRVRPIS